MRSRALLCLMALTFALTTTARLRGQAVGTSQVSGVVIDPSGAAVPGATVALTQTATGITRTTVTSSTGTYVVPNLQVGPYELRVTKTGFTAYVQTGIVLQISVNPTINITLQVGSVTQQVTVSAPSPMLETENTGVGQVVNQRQVVDLPLNGRQATQLIFLSGAATPAPGGDLNTNKNYPTVTISVAGGRPNEMVYILDGAINNDPFNSLNLPIPFPDALQEFKVETNSLPAQYGVHAFAAVNAVTKSGTNQFHGDAFEFVRNYMFNAANYFGHGVRDSLKRNQFGGVIGGPIKQNKLFFFGGYQGTIVKSNPPSRYAYVPTAAMLNNGNYTSGIADFSQYVDNCDPGLVMPAPFGTDGAGQNQLNLADYPFSPQALALMQYVPAAPANDPLNPSQPNYCGRIQYGSAENYTDRQGLGRIDWHINSKQSLFGRYFIARYDLPSTWDGKNILEVNHVGQLNKDQSFDLGYNYILSPTMLNSLHLVVNRTLGHRTLPSFFSPCDLGVNMSCLSSLDGYGGFSIGGFGGPGFNIGVGATNPGYFNSTAYQVADDFSWIRGNHQISFGMDYMYNIMNTVNNRPTNGAFTFSSGTPGKGSVYGLQFADLLLGQVDSFLQGNPALDNDKSKYIAIYGQDSWKVTPRFTFNYGVRWEPFLPESNTNGFVEQFIRSNFDNGVTTSVYTNAPAGLIFPGDPGYPDHRDSERKLDNFEPRLGLVWDATGTGKIILRSGYGIFYDIPQLFFYTRMSNNPPWGAQLNLPDVPFADPYANYPGGNPFPGLNSVGKDMPFPLAGIYNVFPPNMRPPYIQTWNLSLEEQVGGWLFSEVYMGNKTTHMWLGKELNPAVYDCGDPSICGANATSGNRNQRRVLYLANSAIGQYYSTVGQVDDGGNANYNGMVLSAQHPLTHHLSLLTNWTWSHCLSDAATIEMTGPTYPNPVNRDYANCNSDIRHVVNISLIAASPSSFSNSFLSNRYADLAFRNWQFSTIFEGRKGTPSTVTTRNDYALSGIGGQRPEQILADIYPANRTHSNYLNPAAFGPVPSGQYSSMGAYTVRNPGSTGVDFSLQRNFPIREGQTIQFRWEVFNAPNLVNFGSPNTTWPGGTFGEITSAGDPRIMQFALKYVF